VNACTTVHGYPTFHLCPPCCRLLLCSVLYCTVTSLHWEKRRSDDAFWTAHDGRDVTPLGLGLQTTGPLRDWLMRTYPDNLGSSSGCIIRNCSVNCSVLYPTAPGHCRRLLVSIHNMHACTVVCVDSNLNCAYFWCLPCCFLDDAPPVYDLSKISGLCP
jgi:hypothetical protein